MQALFAAAAALSARLPTATQPVMGAYSFWVLVRQSLGLVY